ncbi:MAG: bifunctional 5,10-methylenetetrahydrofolate dehydrogenase/5,10-methenyltetrahydrofolate cyclohydrolase [Solirubrobacteraceae bacterium]
MVLLDGLKVSKEIKNEIKNELINLLNNNLRPPHLAAILVGGNGASTTYVNSKIKDCEEVGFKSTLIKLNDDISENALLEEIYKLNDNNELDGFIVQLPLPKHINEEKVLLAVSPAKDVDGFHPENFGRMALDLDTFIPATPFGIITLIDRYNIPTDGKNVVVIGRSNIVGRPISILMSKKGMAGNATVTVVHSKTQNLEFFTKNADIIVVALGVPNFLKAHMVKDGVVVIDVGITRVEDQSKKGFKLIGDVDFEGIKTKCSYITPVPGGVGPMTRAMLLKNTMLAYRLNILEN